MQSTLGFRRYLYWFALFKIRTLRWDRKERDFRHVLSLVGSDAIVLDIGANVGIMTALLGRRCSQGTVHAFEPTPENIDTLRRVIRRLRLSNVRLHELALGDREGEVEMVMPEKDRLRMQGLSHVVQEGVRMADSGRRYRVPVRRLDDLEAVARGVDAIKIDVENYEHRVLLGGRETLRKFRPLIYCELWSNENREKCFSLLQGELGYAVKVLVNGELVEFQRDEHDKQNFFFV